MSQTEHHTTLSELGFYFKEDDLPIINSYQGKWVVPDLEPAPNNFWAVTTDGKGHPVTGRPSPAQVLSWAEDQGWQVAYVAPYGRYVEGEQDGIKLHDWILEGRSKRRHRNQWQTH